MLYVEAGLNVDACSQGTGPDLTPRKYGVEMQRHRTSSPTMTRLERTFLPFCFANPTTRQTNFHKPLNVFSLTMRMSPKLPT